MLKRIQHMFIFYLHVIRSSHKLLLLLLFVKCAHKSCAQEIYSLGVAWTLSIKKLERTYKICHRKYWFATVQFANLSLLFIHLFISSHFYISHPFWPCSIWWRIDGLIIQVNINDFGEKRRKNKSTTANGGRVVTPSCFHGLIIQSLCSFF